MSYDHSKFGVIERHWFHNPLKYGGDAAAPTNQLGTCDATTLDHVARFYPNGPIRLRKFGAQVLNTAVGGGGTTFDRVPVRLTVNGDQDRTASAEASFNVADAAAAWSIASTSTFTNAVVDNGSYIGIRTGTPESGDGTAANTATVTGTLRFFIDYTREEGITAGTTWDR